MAGEGVPERVRRHGRPDSRAPGGLFDDSPEPLAGEPPARAVDEERSRVGALHQRRPRRLEVRPHPVEGLGAHGNQPLPVSLARRDDVAGGEVQVLDPERQAFRGAHAGGVEEFEEGPVPEPGPIVQGRRLHEGRGLLRRQRARQPPGRPRPLQVLGGITPEAPFPHEEAVEPAHGREVARDAARPEPRLAEGQQVPRHVVGARGLDRRPAPAQESEEPRQVTAVGGQSVGGGPPLRLEGFEVLGHGIHQR